MKILVTGGGGFLGNYIVKELLDLGHDVRVFSRTRSSRLSDKNVDIVLGDVKNIEQVQKACCEMDMVFHVAAKTGEQGSYQSFYQTNVEGTLNIVQSCKHAGVSKLIFTSSPSVVIGKHSINDGNEGLPYVSQFFNAYQKTKALSEKIVLDADEVNGLRTTVLRPHAIWGEGDETLLPRVLERANKRKLKIIGTGNNKISFCHVESCARAHIQAAFSENTSGRCYFINDLNPINLWSWINKGLEQLGLPKVTKRIPLRIALPIALVSEFWFRVLGLKGEPYLSRYTCYLFAKDHYFNTSAAQHDFGFIPLPDIDDKFYEMINHYKESLELA